MPKEHDTSADTFVRHIFQLPLQIYMKTAPFNYKACALLGQGERREGEIIKLASLSMGPYANSTLLLYQHQLS